jgi:hypothetical protein
VDKCLRKDQAERWSVKQLLDHEFIHRYCDTSRAAGNHPSGDGDSGDDNDDAGAKRPGSGDDGKDQLEMDEIVHKAVEYYMKEAKERIAEHGYSLDDTAAWIQQLPAMQKAYASL